VNSSLLRLEWSYLRRRKALFAAALLSRSVWEIVPMQIPFLAGVIVDGLSGKGLRIPGLADLEMDPERVLRPKLSVISD
jgi:hypothetical protein